MASREQCDRKQERHERVEAVQKDKFRKFGEIANPRVIRGKVSCAGNPADMRPPEAANGGRMHVLFFIRMFMVQPVLVTPPQRTALHGGGAQDGEQKLRQPRGVERFMRKIAVIKTGHRKHPDKIHGRCHRHRRPAPAHEKHPQATEMQQNERQNADKFHFVWPGADGGQIGVAIIGIEPMH